MAGPEDSPSRRALAARIAKYAYTPSPAKAGSLSSTPRSSPRKRPAPVGNKLETSPGDTDGDEEDDWRPSEKSTPSPTAVSRSTSITPRRKKRQEGDTDASPGLTPGKSKKVKVPRGYAPPETYAHLKNTPDHLQVGLKIIFCGINPGKQSAATGTHFAHPTNKFWRSLHQSELTSRLYAPSECHLLPDEQSYGLTNLCGRPTAEQAELSPLEMRLNVHPFTLKIIHYRPRIVCFVGKKIWDIYASVCGKTATASLGSVEPGRSAVLAGSLDGGMEGDGGLDEFRVVVPIKQEVGREDLAVCVPIKQEIRSGRTDGLIVLQEPPDAFEGDFKPIIGGAEPDPTCRARDTQATAQPSTSAAVRSMSSSRQSRTRSGSAKALMDWHAPRPLRLPLPHQSITTSSMHKRQEYTYFWVTPSTSGLERTPMAELVAIFASMKAFSDRLEAGYGPPAADFRDIDIDGLTRTSENIRSTALAQGKTVLDSVHALTYG